MTESLAERWQRLRRTLPASSRLLAVSKGHPAESIRVLAGFGQVAFGESRLQEALPKMEQLSDLALQWHFIGRLQSNKVRAVVKAFAVIHSVDSMPLAQRVSRIAEEEGCCPEVLLQVKLRDDPNKGGLSANDLQRHWSGLVQLPALRISGLMTMAPQGLAPKERRQLFSECRQLADQLGLVECSMGMSGDWQEAAASGSTWLRLGSAVFGPRQMPPTGIG